MQSNLNKKKNKLQFLSFDRQNMEKNRGNGRVRNSAHVESDVSTCPKKRRNTSNRKGDEQKPQLLISFDPIAMLQKKFLYVFHAIFRLTYFIPSTPSTTEVHTSWEGCAITQIRNLANNAQGDVNIHNRIKPSSFPHYAKILHYLIEVWFERVDRQKIIFKVGKFEVLMQPGDLYCSDKDKRIKPSYATLKVSKKFNKKCCETLINYIMGNHDKVNRHIETPQDAIALCAVLFSEVIRYPDMFFHNILLMQHIKSWNELMETHPMLRGGSWKNQNKDVPEKVKKMEQKYLLKVANKMKEQYIVPQIEEVDS